MESRLPFVVESPKVQYNRSKDILLAAYDYQTTRVEQEAGGRLRVKQLTHTLTLRTDCKVPRVGCMLVGWGGNNGCTVTASVLVNKLNLQWRTRDGVKRANYFTQASTGLDGRDVYVPLKDLLPMLNPNDIEFDGWDINLSNLASTDVCAHDRTQVIDIEKLKPRPFIYYQDFIAANQKERANNVLKEHEPSSLRAATVSDDGLLTSIRDSANAFSRVTELHETWLGGVSPPPDYLGDHDLRWLLRSTWEARSKWYNIGLELQLTPGTLDSIKADNDSVDDRFKVVLSTWLKGVQATLSSLADALKSPTVGYGQLAEQILKLQ